MSKRIIFLVSEDGDWETMYVDGFLVAEGHRLELRDIMKGLEIEYENYEMSSEYSEFSNSYPNMLPDDFKNVYNKYKGEFENQEFKE